MEYYWLCLVSPWPGWTVMMTTLHTDVRETETEQDRDCLKPYIKKCILSYTPTILPLQPVHRPTQCGLGNLFCLCVFQASAIDKETKGSCPICQHWFMITCLLGENQDDIDFKVYTVQADCPPKNFGVDQGWSKKFPVVMVLAGHDKKGQDLTGTKYDTFEELELFFESINRECPELKRKNAPNVSAMSAVEDVYNVSILFICVRMWHMGGASWGVQYCCKIIGLLTQLVKIVNCSRSCVWSLNNVCVYISTCSLSNNAHCWPLSLSASHGQHTIMTMIYKLNKTIHWYMCQEITVTFFFIPKYIHLETSKKENRWCAKIFFLWRLVWVLFATDSCI